MKICLVHSLYKPYTRGGAEVVVEVIVRELTNQGHVVVLITMGRQPLMQREGRLTTYRIKPLNVFSFLDIDKRPVWLRLFWHPLDVFNVTSYWTVKRILAREKQEVVMTHNLKGIGYLIPRAIRVLKLRHWHTVHDVQLSRPSGLILFGQEKPFLIIDKIYEKIVRRLFGNPEMVISPSRWLLEYYTTRGFFYESKRVVMPNPIVFRKVEKGGGLVVTKDMVTLLYVGQIERHKGVLFLISACKKLTSNNWHLFIVGSGQAESQVKDLVGDDRRFTLAGLVNQEQLTKYYRGADLTVVPSLCYENSPKVIDESLAANVPVIASDIGGVSEIVKDDYNGFTFAAGNEKNLIEVLEHFLMHRQNIDALKKNCFVSVRQYS